MGAMVRKFGSRKLLLPALAATLLLGVGAFAHDGWWRPRKPLEFSEAELFIEINDTDGDAGIQCKLDGEQWEKLSLFGPYGRKLLTIQAGGSVKKQGLTELFFESAEPSFDEVSREEFLKRFPAGWYHFRGRTIDGRPIVGKARFTHWIPDAPVILSPEEDEEVDPEDVKIQWDEVDTPAGIHIVGYEVIVSGEENGRTFSAEMPADATCVTVPPEFLEYGTEYKVEVLAIEKSGNQTITESSFETEEEE